MNLEPNKDSFHDFPVFLQDQASPYLSPFHGLHSANDSHSFNQIPQVHLESQNQNSYAISGPSEEFPNSVKDPSIFQQEEKIQDEEIPSFNPQNLDLLPQKIDGDINEDRTIRPIISLLVENDTMNEKDLLRIGRPFYQDSHQKLYIFKVLMPKFMKLRKTKQQMTKYCMRKAFKFIGELKVNTKKRSTGKSSKKEDSEAHLCLDMPFKKNSSDKTMNSNFLKRTFSQKEFVQGYHKFLTQFHKLMQEDNQTKIDFLANMIQRYWQTNQLEKIESIKRLPWTRTILNKTEQLAIKLSEFGEGEQMDSK